MTLGTKNMVFCNGQPMDWARWPNNSDNNIYTVEGAEVTGGSASTIESPAINSTNWAGAYVWYLGAHSGTSWTRKITASQTGKITFESVNINKWPFSSHNPTVWRSNEGNHRGQFFIFGKLAALDHENEWFFDDASKTIYFQAPGNTNPNGLNVEIAERERTVYINGKKFISINNLHFFGGKAEITGTDCEIKNCSFKNCLHVLDDLNNTSAQVANAPVHVRASRTLIENNIIDGSSLNGIYIQGWNGVTEVTIKNNLIKNCNTVGIHASPIRSGATHVKMIGNTIQTTGRDGIYCGGTNCEIAYNDVFDCMRINNDGGMFYVVGNASDKNNEVHHNWFHDSWGPNYADGRCAGIYLDNNSKGYSVHHNVVWNVSWTGIQINWDNWNIDIFNNSIYNVENAMGRWENGYTIKDLVIKNNYASVADWIGTDVSQITNIISADSPFRSVLKKDFRPKLGSGLIDRGEAISGITDGFKGTAPDIGAYEDGVKPWIPGQNGTPGGEPDFPVSTNVLKKKSEINIYPNPLSKNLLHINLNVQEPAYFVSGYNLIGKQIFHKLVNSDSPKIHRNDFPAPGIYVIEVLTNTKRYSETIEVL